MIITSWVCKNMNFELVGELSEIETIAINLGIRELKSLKEKYGGRKW